jgi:hypothetical protein
VNTLFEFDAAFSPFDAVLNGLLERLTEKVSTSIEVEGFEIIERLTEGGMGGNLPTFVEKDIETLVEQRTNFGRNKKGRFEWHHTSL